MKLFVAIASTAVLSAGTAYADCSYPTPPDHLPAEAAVAALRLAASQGPDYAGLMNAFVLRALQIFAPPMKGARA